MMRVWVDGVLVEMNDDAARVLIARGQALPSVLTRRPSERAAAMRAPEVKG